jgi:DMSO/TMAO reductase YedYZ molybdopterin-dependent catalytic subunit
VHDGLKLSTTEDTEVQKGRRQFLRTLAVASVVVSAISTGLGLVAARIGRRLSGRRWSDDHALPNAAADTMPLSGTRPEFTALEDFYRIDTDTRAPAIDETRWRLSIGGLVERPQTLTLTELRALEPIDLFATLCCISNPIGGNLISTTRWTGISLQRLLPRLGIQPSATHLKVTSADGFFESIALDTIRADARVMLAYAWDGVPLPIEHGYPLRLFVPDVYGMKQPKWIVGLDAIGRWEPGYWVVRGWSKDGRVSTTSVIDGLEVTRLDLVVVAVGGIAFAGARGISKVEVRLDDGEWRPAQLRRPLSELTWVIWRAEMRADAGQHVLTVRAFDGSGQPQQPALHARHFLL